MNIEYINYFKSSNKQLVKKIYVNSFPKNERFNFEILKLCSENNILNEIRVDNNTVGMIYILIIKNTAYIMYFAIDQKYRNKGYGSYILDDLVKKYDNVILSIEKPKNEISLRRKKFYLRNGFYETNKYTIQAKVQYELLCSNKEYNLTKENLIKIYSHMTNSKIISYILDKRFGLFDIDLTID